MRNVALFLVLVAASTTVCAQDLEQLFRTPREQMVENLLDRGAILLSSSGRPTTITRKHIGRQLLCFSENKRRLVSTEITTRLLGGNAMVVVRCNNGHVSIAE